MIVLSQLVYMILLVEIYFYAIGQRAMIQATAIREIVRILPSFAVYLVAFIVAAVEYFGHENATDHDYDNSTTYSNDVANSSSSVYNEPDSHRSLAGSATTHESSKENANHIPMLLVLAGYMVSSALFYIQLVFFVPAGGLHKESSVPMNIDFGLHRGNEWIMLMFGESVFSILIVNSVYDTAETEECYTVFFGALLFIILVQVLHFRSQPAHANDHAMRRHKNAGIGWKILQDFYSFALVMQGSVFT
jgi:hypothetical protein